MNFLKNGFELSTVGRQMTETRRRKITIVILNETKDLKHSLNKPQGHEDTKNYKKQKTSAHSAPML